MKPIIPILITILFSLALTATATSDFKQDFKDAMKDPGTAKLIKNERINVFIDNQFEWSTTTKHGIIQNITDNYIKNPTLNIYTKSEGLNQLKAGEITFEQALNQNIISLKGVGFKKSLKFGIAGKLSKIVSFFKNLVKKCKDCPPTTIQCGTTNATCENTCVNKQCTTCTPTCSEDEIIEGTDQADTLDGEAGKDEIYAKAGDDTIIFDINDILIDGGLGTDTLSQINTELDTTSHISSIEILDTTLLGTIRITAADINTLSSSNSARSMTTDNIDLFIDGEGKVELDEDWTQVGTNTYNGELFNLFENSISIPTVRLAIQSRVSVTID
ncbi:hypothetical protein ACFL3V_07220 [Nanoarchaeota archaeon]